MGRKHYYGIDFLRTFSCIGIIMLHMVANNSYTLSDTFKDVTTSFTSLVFLFMAISAFGLCVGYYEKVDNSKIDWKDFYKKRYLKILPFFSLLVFIDVIISRTSSSLIEGITDLTLLFGLFPNNISVIGVGWFLGVVFAFYFIFPFFCSLLSNRTFTWFSFGVSILLNYFCETYYNIGKNNIIYCLPYFFVGGLIFLYNDYIKKIKWYLFLPITFASIAAYYILGTSLFTNIIVIASLIIQAIITPINSDNLISSIFIFVSNVSMEIYLSHMLIFRIFEKLNLNIVLGNGPIQYCVTVLSVLLCTIAFAFVAHKTIDYIISRLIVHTRQ